jgi:phage terminase large subunit-like protein
MGAPKKIDEGLFAEPDLIALARLDFAIFVELAFPVLHPGKKLIHAPYIDLMALVLTRIAEGKRQRYAINLPPGYMKSMMVSVMYTAWRLGIDPTWKFVCISYGDDLAHKLSVLTRTLMLSPVYRKIFPGTVLEKKAEDHLATTKGGFRYATAVHSDITGFRPNDIVVDDPLEPEDATNELVKEKLRSWFESSVTPRLIDSAKGSITLVMHRVAPDDLTATFLKDKSCFHLSLPLVAEKKEKFTRNGKPFFQRLPGERLNPNRTTAKEVKRLQAETPRHIWNSLYQQRPTLGGSGMISLSRLRRYALVPPPDFELIIHSWDIGGTVTGNASVCTKYGVARDDDELEVVCLTDVIRLKVELADVRDAIKAQDAIDKPDLIAIDPRGIGLGIYQDLAKEGYRHLKPRYGGESNEGKTERFGKACLVFYDGGIAFPTSAPWLDDVFYDLATFPHLKEFDLVDSITQLAAHLPRALMFARQKRRPADLG